MRFTLILFLLFLCQSTLPGQGDISLFHLLDSLGGVKITLTYPFDSLYKTQQDEIKALISIETSQGQLLAQEPLSLNLRGRFRRMKCEMPPLELNFKKSTLEKLGLNKHDKMKLVTHCLTTKEGQENLQEEYLCYKTYEAVSDYAYRTVWIEITYIDQSNSSDQMLSSAFLIEPDDDIEERFDVKEYKVFNIAEDSLDMDSYSKAASFNFMIGNLDWSLVMARNIKLFKSPKLQKCIAIPYDFDYSNVVDATYRRESRPDKMLHEFDRYFQGEYFKSSAGKNLSSFCQYRNRILETVQTFENPMDEKRRNQIAKYFSTWLDDVSKTRPEKLFYGMVIPYRSGL
jgi:hypothetical protein